MDSSEKRRGLEPAGRRTEADSPVLWDISLIGAPVLCLGVEELSLSLMNSSDGLSRVGTRTVLVKR